MQTLWMNVYRAGYWHRQGKPGNVDLHAGDFYTSFESAWANRAPLSHWLGTVSFDWSGQPVQENPADSVPVPLSVSRAQARV